MILGSDTSRPTSRSTGAGRPRRAQQQQAKQGARQAVADFMDRFASSLFSSSTEKSADSGRDNAAAESLFGAGMARGGGRGTAAPATSVQQWTGMTRGGPGLQQVADRQAEAEAAAETARENRMAALQMSTGALTTTPDMLKDSLDQLTTEEYLKLSDRQKAAVDFNTLLSEAVRKDLSRQEEYDDVSSVQREKYASAEDALFGEDRGSEIYAPETMAVLRQLDLSKDDNADLDDFLNLSAAVTADDLKYFEKPSASIMQPEQNLIQSWVAGDDPTQLARANYQTGLVDNTEALRNQLAKGNQMLQNFRATARVDRSQDSTSMGGLSKQTPLGLGFGSGEVDQYFREAFEALGNKKLQHTPDEVLAEMSQLLTPDEMDAFRSYADARTQNADVYGVALGTTEGATYRKPDEFRKLLGLDK